MMASHLGPDTDFEKAAVKIQRGMEEDLTRPEKTQVRCFLLNDAGKKKELIKLMERSRTRPLSYLKKTECAREPAFNYQHNTVA